MFIVLKQILLLYIFLFLGYLFGKRKTGLLNQTGILSFFFFLYYGAALAFSTS